MGSINQISIVARSFMILLQLTEIVGLQTNMSFLLLLETHNCIRHKYVSDILIFCGSYGVKMDN